MFSTTIKRSVATLGVVAGLLAAAGPASAQILDGPVLAKAGPQPEAGGYLATDPSSEVDNQIRLSIGGAEAAGFVKAPANATSVSNEAVDLMNNWVTAPTNAGTQVGSEGVKVPIEEMDLSGHAVRSPESTKVAMEKNDTLHTRTHPNFFFDIPG
jgi:hypothetical protein